MAGSSNIKDFIQWALCGFLVAMVTTFFLNRWDRTPKAPTNQPIIKLGSTTTTPTLPVISEVQPFSLTNQLGKIVTKTDLDGSPWLANIIFTRCPTVCPKITQTVSTILPELPEALKVVSLTTDPAHDTPTVLGKFAELNQAQTDRWYFLTGDKASLMKLAVTDLKMISKPKTPDHQESPNDLFVHSSLLILVDGAGQVRASFESDSPDLLNQIQAALKKLNP